MSDWQVGDLALCVLDGPWYDWAADGNAPADGPKYGDVLLVTEASIDTEFDGELELGFGEWPGELFEAAVFRKIRPDEPEACETEFVELLNLSKKRVSA